MNNDYSNSRASLTVCVGDRKTRKSNHRKHLPIKRIPVTQKCVCVSASACMRVRD